MNILWAWVTALTLVFMATVAWYASTPMVMILIDTIQNDADLMGLIKTEKQADIKNSWKIIGYIQSWWVVGFILFILLWVITYSQKRDPYSYMYE